MPRMDEDDDDGSALRICELARTWQRFPRSSLYLSTRSFVSLLCHAATGSDATFSDSVRYISASQSVDETTTSVRLGLVRGDTML